MEMEERERGRHNSTHSNGQRVEIHLQFTTSHFSFSSLLFTIKQHQFATKDTALEEESFYDPKVPEFLLSSSALFALLRSSSSQW